MGTGVAGDARTPWIDTTFDFRSDADGGDPDRTSPTLRRYHQILWSKDLPCGRRFDLDTTTEWEYLHHRSDLGEFFLSSDAVIATYQEWISTRDLIAQMPEGEVDEFETLGRRALLNLGHTFGHALEAEAGFSDKLLHGEAVAAGCALAFGYSAAHGLCPIEDAVREGQRTGEIAASLQQRVERRRLVLAQLDLA